MSISAAEIIRIKNELNAEFARRNDPLHGGNADLSRYNTAFSNQPVQNGPILLEHAEGTINALLHATDIKDDNGNNILKINEFDPFTEITYSNIKTSLDSLSSNIERLVFTESSPTAAKINTFVTNLGYTDTTKWSGITVYTSTNGHVWRYESSTWKDKGLETSVNIPNGHGCRGACTGVCFGSCYG